MNLFKKKSSLDPVLKMPQPEYDAHQVIMDELYARSQYFSAKLGLHNKDQNKQKKPEDIVGFYQSVERYVNAFGNFLKGGKPYFPTNKSQHSIPSQNKFRGNQPHFHIPSNPKVNCHTGRVPQKTHFNPREFQRQKPLNRW